MPVQVRTCGLTSSVFRRTKNPKKEQQQQQWQRVSSRKPQRMGELRGTAGISSRHLDLPHAPQGVQHVIAKFVNGQALFQLLDCVPLLRSASAVLAMTHGVTMI